MNVNQFKKYLKLIQITPLSQANRDADFQADHIIFKSHLVDEATKRWTQVRRTLKRLQARESIT